MIEASGLSKSFRKKGGKKNERVLAIREVGFKAKDGEITGLLGPNGAGKSTTLRILATLMQPDAGQASIDGIDVQAEPTRARGKIGFLPHNSGIYPRLTAGENVAYFASISGMPENKIEQRVHELIKLLDMQDIVDRRAEGFSQGQKTKVALARAMVHSPQTLMLDEPTNGLDVMATRNLRRLIKRLAEEGRCVLFSSHIMQEVAALCDHIAIISDGRIAMADSLDQLRLRTGQEDLEDAFVIAIGESLEDEHA